MNPALRLLVLAAPAGVFLAALAGCDGGSASLMTPPSFSAAEPNEYRILPSPGFHAPCSRGNCSLPDQPSIAVTNAAGAKVDLLIDPDQRQDNPQRMQIRICPTNPENSTDPQMDKCDRHLVAAGGSFTDLGMKVTVRRLWWMPDDKNDAVDAVITTA